MQRGQYIKHLFYCQGIASCALANGDGRSSNRRLLSRKAGARGRRGHFPRVSRNEKEKKRLHSSLRREQRESLTRGAVCSLVRSGAPLGHLRVDKAGAVAYNAFGKFVQLVEKGDLPDEAEPT
jgi:hypothetical protein